MADGDRLKIGALCCCPARTARGSGNGLLHPKFKARKFYPVCVLGILAFAGDAFNFQEYVITKETDCSSPKLLEADYTGQHIKEIIIEACRAGGDKQKYLEIKMEQVIVSKFRQASSGGIPIEVVQFSPGKINMTYSKQKREDGTLGGNVSAGWDLTKNKPI